MSTRNKRCHCSKCGTEGKVLHIKTWNDHQNAERRWASHQHYSLNVLKASASGSNIDTKLTFDEPESGPLLWQLGSNNLEPDVFLAPPLPGFINDCNNDLSLEFEAIQPGNDDSTEDDNGSQTSSDEESNSTGIPIDSGSSPLDETTLQAGSSSTLPSPISLVHSTP
ncbi:uncharacterized protein EI90DRAFT_3020582 [Cantharellus anzutake]|uniref:uncharacterized protein n=1 Tax=Cantharellus anzutake TaxID=1750568 RepID=UPI0019071460|nr:uncharacterized protein EI90DRAFT_3020582 [Cantharellus anzutake]KAF8320169.1 hypothetical protein EI90DRAFT_3020582 [Cantharellus anzutake]